VCRNKKKFDMQTTHLDPAPGHLGRQPKKVWEKENRDEGTKKPHTPRKWGADAKTLEKGVMGGRLG